MSGTPAWEVSFLGLVPAADGFKRLERHHAIPASLTDVLALLVAYEKSDVSELTIRGVTK